MSVKDGIYFVQYASKRLLFLLHKKKYYVCTQIDMYVHCTFYMHTYIHISKENDNNNNERYCIILLVLDC